MIYIYRHGNYTYEFDATSRADELVQVRAICKRYGYKLKDLVKETRDDNKNER